MIIIIEGRQLKYYHYLWLKQKLNIQVQWQFIVQPVYQAGILIVNAWFPIVWKSLYSLFISGKCFNRVLLHFHLPKWNSHVLMRKTDWRLSKITPHAYKRIQQLLVSVVLSSHKYKYVLGHTDCLPCTI